MLVINFRESHVLFNMKCHLFFYAYFKIHIIFLCSKGSAKISPSHPRKKGKFALTNDHFV
jgi:hypothetical protein